MVLKVKEILEPPLERKHTTIRNGSTSYEHCILSSGKVESLDVFTSEVIPDRIIMERSANGIPQYYQNGRAPYSWITVPVVFIIWSAKAHKRTLSDSQEILSEMTWQIPKQPKE